MNECELAGRLGAYHDGELSGPARAEIEQHLRHCPSCAAELERIRRLSTLLHSVSTPKPSPVALAQWHRRIDLEPSFRIRRLAETLAAVAAVILVGCLTSLIWSAWSDGVARTIPLWEVQAVAGRSSDAASASQEKLLATWMVADLAWRAEGD